MLHSEVVDTNGSGHGALAGVLNALNADVLICGGIGGGAQTALAAAGIKLFGGVSGDADKAVEAFINDTLDYNPDEMSTRQFVFWTRKVIVRSSVQNLCRSQERRSNGFTRLPERK